jgi:hypothetical protein
MPLPPEWGSPRRFRDLPLGARIILIVLLAGFVIGFAVLAAAGEIPGRTGY